jgi:hypothetical protein
MGALVAVAGTEVAVGAGVAAGAQAAISMAAKISKETIRNNLLISDLLKQ